MKIKCFECGKKFKPGNRPDGLPNGMGFLMDDGQIINMCTECIIKHGKEESEKRMENENDI